MTSEAPFGHRVQDWPPVLCWIIELSYDTTQVYGAPEGKWIFFSIARERSLAKWSRSLAKWSRSLAKWSRSLAKWSPSLAKWSRSLAKWSPSLAKWSRSLAKWSRSLAKWSRSLAKWSRSLAKWSRSLAKWSRSLAKWSRSLAKWSPSLAKWSRSLAKWSPSLAIEKHCVLVRVKGVFRKPQIGVPFTIQGTRIINTNLDGALHGLRIVTVYAAKANKKAKAFSGFVAAGGWPCLYVPLNV